MALIPARGGSRGVQGKNLRPLGWRSLVARAVNVALQACGNAWVSTEDPNIGLEAHNAGARVIWRPEDLATDEAAMLPVVRHALDQMAGDVVVLLQPTQPLRTVEHVKAALRLLEETGADSVVSVVEIPAHYSPDYAMKLQYDLGRDTDRLVPFLPDAYRPGRRQDCRPAYSRDGTVYAIRRETIEAGSLYGADCRALVIPAGESCNIDTEDDWRRAESMVKNG